MDFKASEAFPPPSDQLRLAFAQRLGSALRLDKAGISEVVVLLSHYDQVRTQVIDQYAKLASEAVAVQKPRPVLMDTAPPTDSERLAVRKWLDEEATRPFDGQRRYWPADESAEELREKDPAN
jgi:hypothetical protein